jgi:hypothetical protein
MQPCDFSLNLKIAMQIMPCILREKVYVTQIDIIESLKLSFSYSHHMSRLEQESWARGPEYAVIVDQIDSYRS